MIEIKPCPFCGSEDLDTSVISMDRFYIGSCYCRSCGVQLVSNPCQAETVAKKDIVDKWNTRILEDQLTEVLQKVANASHLSDVADESYEAWVEWIDTSNDAIDSVEYILAKLKK